MRTRTFRFFRYLPERLLHARRRNAAATLLRSADIASVVFLCHGNVCRSPYAAASFSRAVLATRLGASIQVTSAGFIGPGRTPPETALSVAAGRGLDLSAHRSALVTTAIIRAASLVVVMSAQQAAAVQAQYGHDRLRVLVLGDLDPLPIATRTITDPWGKSVHVFDAVFERVDRCVAELTRLLPLGKNSDSPLVRSGL
jgi:protein-tyrosine-phosphatase